MKGRQATGTRLQIKAGIKCRLKKEGPMAATLINTAVMIRNSFSDIVSTSKVILILLALRAAGCPSKGVFSFWR